ncbi:T9SS type A sorting domain-containing protein [Halothiobacillus sp. DCM-1]|uniref:T9SS type A sorting domain-containing protein n=1 Tax=Halothiobacillus sp. DCM-1 TaxID=3112558 RepID=UPI00324C5FE1
MNRSIPLVLALVGYTAAGMAWAANPEQPTIQSLTPSEISSGALTPHEAQGIRYVSGGIGIEERGWLAQHGREFNVHATFALAQGGSFVADVRVEIKDASGKTLLTTTANGPKFLAALKPGAYTLVATHDGQSLTRQFTVGAKGTQQLGFGFKS